MAGVGHPAHLRVTGQWDTVPSAIPGNISTMYSTLYGNEPKEHPPSPDFVRRCRTIVQVIGETIGAIKLASAKEWGQLWTDATARRQIPFTALIIGLMPDPGDDDAVIDPVVVSSCIFTETESADSQAEGIINKVSAMMTLMSKDIISLASMFL